VNMGTMAYVPYSQRVQYASKDVPSDSRLYPSLALL